MGFLDNLWKKISGEPTLDQFFARLPDSRDWDGQPLPPDECYVELYADSLRLKKARKFSRTFAGVVYSFATLAREGDANAEFAAISKPAKLANLDADSIGSVIPVDKKMMAATAWRGGQFGLELGLFSVKTGDLLSPVVDFVTRVSETAGISFVGAIKPFVPLITEGLGMIAGQKDDTNLEVGVDTSLNLAKTGTYVVIDAPKNSIDVAKLSLDSRDGKLLMGGQPLLEAYCVFSVRRRDDKPDYGEIPALKEKYAALQAAIRGNKQKDAEEALTAFRLETIASQDLITKDARRLVQRASDKVKEAFTGGGVSADRSTTHQLEALAEIGLYG